MIVELHFWMLVHLVLVRLVALNQELLTLLQEVETCESFLKNNEYMSRKLVKVVSHFDGLKSADMITSENITRKGNSLDERRLDEGTILFIFSSKHYKCPPFAS